MTPTDGRDFMKDQGQAPFSPGKELSSGHAELNDSVHPLPFFFFSQDVRLI